MATRSERFEHEEFLSRDLRANEIATTIINQLGDAWWAVSARDVGRDLDGTLTFRFGARGGARKQITIELTWMDDYTVTYWRTPTRGANRGKRERVEEHTNIYFDRLPQLVREINDRAFV